jgi:hypothetical protein
VPREVASKIGRTVINKSLRTSSYPEAIRRARTVAGRAGGNSSGGLYRADYLPDLVIGLA